MPDQDPTSTSSAWLLRAGVAGAALLAIAGGAAFYFASQGRQAPQGGQDATVAVTARACEPNELTVPAGKRSFEILNQSDRPVEWEILDGVMVVAERENIAPGFRQTLSARLSPGDYEMTCGLLSNPRGVLHVTHSDEAAEAAATPTLRKLLGPLSEYKFYLIRQSGAMVDQAEALAAAIKAGDLAKARALYEPARVPYKHIEPAVFRFSDLENAIDPVADYLAKREEDPAFTGYHRIEYGLFAENSLDGLDAVADKLVADVTTLKDRLRQLKLSPAFLTENPGAMADQLAQGRIMAGEDHYAHTDLTDLEANLDGIDRIVELLNPVLEPAAPELAAKVSAQREAVRAALDGLRGADGFPPYDTVDEASRKALTEAFENLAAALNQIPDAIGLG
ncbi:iron uptake system protein EfeO [Acuticoccus mangrovi]|uniref:Iron uptake system protein EfeO n=1 Tax=Acuticoccus mangrovi TaxID=2796142 RepID=A0A934IL08_9HYPH|nr:iron uptake system protein EfeO [Acuticoccus mangrovi]MBJ3778458.1 iron uptake system protein EfeO [Acuticoccus mangrovi]